MTTVNDLKSYTFTTGAYIAPLFIDGEWRWIVTSFEHDTFCDGNLIDPREVSDTVEELVHPDDLTSDEDGDTMDVGE